MSPHIIPIILFRHDYCDYCGLLRLLQIIAIIAIIRIIVTMVLKHRRFHHKHHWNVLQVTWHTTLCYLCMPMDCHVIFQWISSCSFVQKRILKLASWIWTGGSHTSLMLAMTLVAMVGTKDNCIWNTHMPWIHCICFSMCITWHKRQVSNTWIPANELSCL